MCLPIASTVADVIQSADQQCIVGLLAKMGKLLLILISMRTPYLNVRFSHFKLSIDRFIRV